MAAEKQKNARRGNGFRWKTSHHYLAGFKVLFIAAVCLSISFAAEAANFTASLDRDTIALGESARLSLVLTLNSGGAYQLNNVPRPNVPGLEISDPNFEMPDFSGNIIVTFSVIPQHTGEFIIPPMDMDFQGQHLRTQPLKLTVQKATAPNTAQINSGSEIAFMRLIVPEKNVYPGQVISAQAQVFLRDDVQNPQGFQFTSLPADGFTVGKMVFDGKQQAQVGNRVYVVVPISMVLTVLKPGPLTIGPVTASITIITGAQNLGGFAFVGGEQRQISLAADPVTVQSLPLPKENAPPSFNGAVGDYTMAVSAGPTNLAVGDPITVRVQISGHGTLDGLTLPPQAGWNDFKVFSPTSKVQVDDGLEDQGTKTFEEIVTPQNANIRELPAFAFSYFNPDDGTYHTLTQPATPLTVAAVAATPLPTIATPKQAVTENQTPQDIVPIRENLGALAQAGAPLITRPAFLALQVVPVLAFISALVWRKRTDNLANNPRLRRQRAVEQLIAGGLVDLNKFASENKSDEFFAVLFRLLQEQLGERLDCPASSITEADVDDRLISRGAKPETLNALRELFQACNQARYAPVQTPQELSAIAGKFKNTVSELQNLKI